MSCAQVHTRIYAFRTLLRRLHSISMTQTNTLTYSHHCAIMHTVTHTLYAYRHAYSKFRPSLQLTGFVSQATMLYKSLFNISTRFRLLEPSSTTFLLFEHTLSAQLQFKLFLARQPTKSLHKHSNIDSNIVRLDCA
jgi:hypothetical protein